jgi:hypothetical protein
MALLQVLFEMNFSNLSVFVDLIIFLKKLIHGCVIKN